MTRPKAPVGEPRAQRFDDEDRRKDGLPFEDMVSEIGVAADIKIGIYDELDAWIVNSRPFEIAH